MRLCFYLKVSHIDIYLQLVNFMFLFLMQFLQFVESLVSTLHSSIGVGKPPL